MEIKTFDDIIEKHQLSKETLKGIEERLCAMANMEKFSFTALQKEAFNTYGYWRGFKRGGKACGCSGSN